jgi:RHS repeat-associated protein
MTYDADRNLTAVTDPLGRTIHYGYDPDGRLISVTDASGQKTTWTRDIEGRVIAKTYADGTSIAYAYDTAGRMITRTDALGQVTHYAYTKDDRVAAVSYSNTVNPTPPVTFTWDTMYPRLAAMSDGTGTTSFTYVPAGQNGALEPAGETGPEGTAAQYSDGYDTLGRINQLAVAGTVQDSVTYDAIGRDVGDVTTLGQINTAYLGETGQQSSVTELGQNVSGSAGVASFSYLPNSGDRRLAGISYNAAPSAAETLTSDDIDRITARTDGTGKADTYSFDNADRLTADSVTAPAPAYTETYGYNAADFIATKSGGPTAADNWTAVAAGLVNGVATLTPSGGTGRTYTYDANGNVVSDGLRKYTWDAENRLLSITEIATGHVSTFTYDGLSRRVAITETSGSTSTTTGYVWCGDLLCAAYSGNTITARYLSQGEVRYSGGTPTDYFYARDHLATVTSMTSATGASEGTLATDAFGLTLSQSGTAPTFGYGGMFLHQPSASLSPLYLTDYRAYDPYSGRWLSRDPVGEVGGINLYGYVKENAPSTIDPGGLFGFGVDVGGNGEGGAVIIGAGGTASAGGGVFFNGLSPSLGGFASGGAFAGGPGWGVSAPSCPDKTNWALGAYAGGGVGVFFTNANNVGDLAGPFKTYSFNAGWGLFNVNLQLSVGSNAAGQPIWYFNYGGPLGFPSGGGFGISLSGYNTNTVTTMKPAGGSSSSCPCQ